MELKAEECVLHPCHGCLTALCCRELFGLDLAGRHQLVVTSPRSQPHRATLLPFYPVVLQLLVSHPMVFICCLTLLSSVAQSIAVPCLGWLCFSGAGRHCLVSVGKERCDFPGCGVLSQGHCPWCQYSNSPPRLPSGFWRTAGVGSPQLQPRPRPSLQSLSQDIEAFHGPREAAMVAGDPLELPPYPTHSAGMSCRPCAALLPHHLDALHSKSRSQPWFLLSDLGHLSLSQQLPP